MLSRAFKHGKARALRGDEQTHDLIQRCVGGHGMHVGPRYHQLTRLQAIVLVQQELFSKIWLRKHKMFDVVFAGGESISDAPAEPLRGIDEQYL